MALTPRRLLLASLVCALAALPACRGARREVDLGGRGTTCLPPLEAPSPVGTEVGEVATRDFILRVHDVRDIFDLMPVVQRVGPRGTRTVPADDALIARLLAQLSLQERSITELQATDYGAVLVKAPQPIQEKVAAAIHGYRTELIRDQVGRLRVSQGAPTTTRTEVPAEAPGEVSTESPTEASTDASTEAVAESPTAGRGEG